MAVQPGSRSVTPHLIVKGAAQALDVHGRAFGEDEPAGELERRMKALFAQ